MTRLRDLEDAPRVGVDDQVEVALAVARLDVLQAVPLLGQRTQRLGEQPELAAASSVSSPVRVRNGRPRTPIRSPRSSEAVELEAVVAQPVAADVDLDALAAVLETEERRLAEVAHRHDASGDGHRGAAAASSASASPPKRACTSRVVWSGRKSFG